MNPYYFNLVLNNLVESLLFSWMVNPYADIRLLQPVLIQQDYVRISVNAKKAL
jgi:hypothetical protein